MSLVKVQAQYVIFGLGISGLSCARFLHRHGLEFAVIDTREQPPCLDEFIQQFPQVAIATSVAQDEVVGRCETVILSPGLSLHDPLVRRLAARGIELIGDIELFARFVRAPVLAVTGSNGKSTVVTMIGEILAAAGIDARVGGNIGIPALQLLDEHRPDCYLLELSSFQLETTSSLKPRAACILNVSPDHMDRYDDLASYARAKARILNGAESVYLNHDDPSLRTMHVSGAANYSLSSGAHTQAHYQIDAEAYLVANGEQVLASSELVVKGRHNLLNALAAIAVSDAMAVPRSAQRIALRSFTGLAHRCQHVATYQDIDWIDDSKGTNVGATVAAIDGVFEQRGGVLIAGGQAKNADFSQLAKVVQSRVHTVVLIGEDANALAAVMPGGVNVHFAIDMDSAVALAARLARAGEAVLLSPACASFDMFANFEARGIAFAAAVNSMVAR